MNWLANSSFSLDQEDVNENTLISTRGERRRYVYIEGIWQFMTLVSYARKTHPIKQKIPLSFRRQRHVEVWVIN